MKILPVLPNNISAEVYITSMDSVVWGFDIDRVPGLIRNGSNTKKRRVTGVHYAFPNDESATEYLNGYVVIGGVQVGVESTDAGKTWDVMCKKREIKGE